MQDKKYWQGLIEEQKRSGKSVAAYCREREINDNKFYFWRKRLDAESESKFVTVIPSDRITLELKTGVIIKVSSADLVPVLRALCAQ